MDEIKRKILIKYPLFGSILANTNIIVSTDIDSLATDGKTIYYNDEYFNKHSIEEKTFLLAHEICHIAFNHINRQKGKNIRIWNIATDAVINAFLKKDGFSIVDGGIDIKEAINYDAEEMYEKLLKENDNENKVDNHNMWNKEKQNNEENNKKISEKEIFKENLKQRKRNLEELKKSLSQTIKNFGTDTNSNLISIKEVGVSKPLIDWRILLRESINYELDWSYQNAEVDFNILIPQLEEQLIPETEIVLDTSGSIDEELLKCFLRECKNIVQTSKVKIGCFDTMFYGFQEIRDIKDIDNLKFIGNGGTNFDVAVEAFTKRVDNKIIFTDGYSNMPSKYLDAIWIVYGVKKINPKGGKVIYINKNELIKTLKK